MSRRNKEMVLKFSLDCLGGKTGLRIFGGTGIIFICFLGISRLQSRMCILVSS